MKFNFKKITSALASTAIGIGSSVGLAMAANYPSPFVKDGVGDVAIVYGNSLDLSAVTDISSSLSTALGSGGSVSVTDEAYALFTGSTPLQLNSSINGVRSSITTSNLPSVLSDTSFSGDVEANVEYKITLGSNPRTVFGAIPTSNDDPIVGVTFSTSSGNYLYNATTTFNKVVMLNHSDSEGETIKLFGQEFVISSATDGTNLILFKSAQKQFLSVGGSNPNPSATVDVNGETYTIELTAATDTSATIKVTDSSGRSDQKEINEAASKKILGVEVGVNNADESTATNILQAEVIIGANRVKLTDGTEVLLGTDEDPIEGTNVDFKTGENPGNLTQFTIQVFAPDGDNDALRAGDAFVDPVFGGFRLALTGLNGDDDREDISIGVSGNDKMTITMTNWQGNTLSNQEWLNNESSAWGKRFLGVGSSDWQIFTSEMAKINSSAYAVVGNEETGLLVRLSSLTNSSGTPIYGNDKVVFQNVFETTQTYEASITSEGTGTVNIAGVEYDVTYRYNKDDAVDNDQFVQLDNKADSTGDAVLLYPTIETSKGAKLAFYEPLTINLGNWKGGPTSGVDALGGRNVSSFKIPDGDGYTELYVARNNTDAIADGIWNFSLTAGAAGTGGATIANDRTFNVTAGAGNQNFTFAIGKLTYGVYSTAKNTIGTSPDTVKIMLNDTTSGNANPITDPAIILFEEKDENNNYEAVVIQVSGNGDSNNGVGVSDVDFTWNLDADMVDGSTYGASGFQRDSDEDIYDMMDLWGTKVTTDRSTSDQYTATISYPNDQVTAMLYVDAPGAGSSSSSLGQISVMDSELASSGMSTKNLVVVGGSCVNTLASDLLGGAACGPSWTSATGASSGEFIIQTFANPNSASKVATLVAGYEAGDTTNAATYLTTQTVDTGVGKKYKGTTSTSASLVTA